jgi:hypothetical protein
MPRSGPTTRPDARSNAPRDEPLEASMAADRTTMTMRELDRFKVIQDVADGELKPWRAAERLGLTTRQIRRLVDRMQTAAYERFAPVRSS